MLKINFKLLGTFETACILDWSSKETYGVLPLSESTFNLYPELRDKIDVSLDNTDLIYEIIKNRIDDFNKKNKSILDKYQNLWNKYNDQYIKIMEDYFGVKICKDVNAYLGLLPVCPRSIEDLSFKFNNCDDIRFIDICMHELCHFYFFELCKRLFKDWTYDDFNNPSLLWYLSEISIDAILNREEVQKIFKHQFRCYDNFYNIYINGECIVDFIKNIFDNNDIEYSIKKCLQFLKDNEIEFRNKCEGEDKMSNINVRRYKDGDAPFICEILKKDVLTENIKDYELSVINKIIENHNEELIERRAKKFHCYVLTDNEKIVGVGMIGPYWDSLTESSFFTIFIDPEYKGHGLGRLIIETLESDEFYKRADRVEIPASITALEFYRHFGYDFKESGHIVKIQDGEGIYQLEKYPKVGNNVNLNQYNMRPYIDNEYHNYKEFIYTVKKNAYKKYVEEYWGKWNDDEQRKYYENFINKVSHDAWIIQLNGVDIGFYNGMELDDGSYEIGNICIIPEYKGRGIGTSVLKDIMELHKDKDLHIQYFKSNPVGKLYERLGFVSDGETEYHFKMKKKKKRNDKCNDKVIVR